ncbi:MAG: hypothetical protein AAF960_23280 [Bacteroidota bacterium]
MLKSLAQIISWLFHPLLMVTYMICLLMVVNPFSFGISQVGEGRSGLLIILVFLQATLIPAIAISMMKGLGLIPDFNTEERTARIGPFLAAGVLYLWLFISFNRLPEVPLVLKSAILGVVIALFTTFILNIFSRISVHTVGVGSLVGMVLVTMLLFSYTTFPFGDQMYSMYSVLFGVILIAGLVGSARVIIERPTPKDLYGGYLVGFATQLIALQFVG